MVVDLSEDEMIIGVFRIVTNGTLVNRGIERAVSRYPCSDEQIPSPVDENTGSDQNQKNRCKFFRDTIDLDFPQLVIGFRQVR